MENKDYLAILIKENEEDILRFRINEKNYDLKINDSAQEHIDTLFVSIINNCIQSPEIPIFTLTVDNSEQDEIALKKMCADYIEILNNEIKIIWNKWDSEKKEL